MGSWRAGEIDGSVYTLLSHGGDLYAGFSLRGYGPASTMVWRLRDSRWELIGGDGVRGSWLHPHIAYVLDLCAFQGTPLACLTRPRTLPAGASSIYALQDETWRPLMAQAPWAMHRSHIYNHAVEWRGRLYVAAGDIRSHAQPQRRIEAAVWELSDDGASWRCVGGGGDWPAWSETDLTRVALDPDRSGGLWIYRMHVHEDTLVCGFAGHRQAGEVWQFTPAAPPRKRRTGKNSVLSK